MNRMLLRGALAAASLVMIAAPHAFAHDIAAGPLRIQAPWIRATPGGAKVAGGYARITNTGREPDRLIGARIPYAAPAEVHEMSLEKGVMKMRPVEGGLLIGPGQTVELKPGGHHLMFQDLTGSLQEGATTKGTLTFEKAGPVEVVFTVGGIGAASAPAHHH